MSGISDDGHSDGPPPRPSPPRRKRETIVIQGRAAEVNSDEAPARWRAILLVGALLALAGIAGLAYWTGAMRLGAASSERPTFASAGA